MRRVFKNELHDDGEREREIEKQKGVSGMKMPTGECETEMACKQKTAKEMTIGFA